MQEKIRVGDDLLTLLSSTGVSADRPLANIAPVPRINVAPLLMSIRTSLVAEYYKQHQFDGARYVRKEDGDHRPVFNGQSPFARVGAEFTPYAGRESTSLPRHLRFSVTSG